MIGITTGQTGQTRETAVALVTHVWRTGME